LYFIALLTVSSECQDKYYELTVEPGCKMALIAEKLLTN